MALAILFYSSILVGQIDSLKASISSEIALGSAGFLPLHIGHNQFGKFDPNSQDGQITGSFLLPWQRGDFKITTGIDAVVKPRIDQSFLHQAFANFSFRDLTLRIGRNEINNWTYNDRLGSGSMFQSRVQV